MIPWLARFVGLWLLATPATFDYHSHPLAWSDWICGAVLLFSPRNRPWTPLIFAAIGLWIGFAPLLFWAPTVASYLNDTVVSAVCIVLFLLSPTSHPDHGPSIPPGWSYNPSSWAQRLPIAFLAFAGWMMSRYLDAYQLGFIDHVWDPFFPRGTLEVITSKVSRAFPVPDAGLGALAYTLETLSVFKGGERRWRTMPWMVIVFGILAIPLSLVSVILIILQPLIVGAWCTLCLTTACCMLVLMTLSIDEVVAALQYLRKSKEKPIWRLLWEGGLCPGAKEDHRTPSLQAPFKAIVQASFWGVSFPCNLLLAALCGVGLICLPAWLSLTGLAANVDHTLGALIVVTSIFSCAETVRNGRRINLVFAACILLSLFFSPFSPLSSGLQALLAFGVVLLSLRQGPIREEIG